VTRPSRRWLVPAAVLLAVLAGTQLPAGARPAPPTTTPVTGNATHFDALGSPYGGCGLPQDRLDTQDFVALNVYDTPGDYGFYPRPVQGDRVGMWDNGRNCGRWVRVTVGDYCTGVNDGAPGQAFCRNGSWVADQYSGATLLMQVADSCGDSNAWCRDDPYHLDLATASLSRFRKDGAVVSGLPDRWNNRHVSWTFVPAPDYTGDLSIGFLRGAQRYWPAIAVGHLPNGIHGVDYFSGGSWRAAAPNSDMGQSFILDGLTPGGTDFRIRVRDSADALGTKEYAFSLPAGCGSQCSAAYTPVPYTTGSASPTPSPTSPSPTPSPVGGSCSVAYKVSSSWTGGFTADVTVRNTGSAAVTGWTLGFTFPGDQRVTSAWNGTATQSGARVALTNAGWNGTLAPGASTTVGFQAAGTSVTPAAFTLNGAACT
jgi:hypothetical protein